MPSELHALLDAALDARSAFLDEAHTSAFRLFNGFLEGHPTLALEVYGKTLVLHDYTDAERGDEAMAKDALAHVRARLPWIDCGLWKLRHAKAPEARNGTVVFGDAKKLARRVVEDGVTYALDLTLNRDTSLYLDTRPLRAWARQHLAGKRVLNAFAYTGSLGVAARSVGAEVVHTDLNNRFLTVAKDSYSMNGWPIRKGDFKAGDFFDVMGQLKRDGQLFDCAFVDPPVRSVTPKGKVALDEDVARVLNKVRPLIAHGGSLVAVNNALFVSGKDFHAVLETLCSDGYLRIESLVPAPLDFVGTEKTRHGTPPVDPAPFNHPTKMAVLAVTRKDEAGARGAQPPKPKKPKKAPAPKADEPEYELPDDE